MTTQMKSSGPTVTEEVVEDIPPAKFVLPRLKAKAQEQKSPLDGLASAAQELSRLQPTAQPVPPPVLHPETVTHQRPTAGFD